MSEFLGYLRAFAIQAVIFTVIVVAIFMPIVNLAVEYRTVDGGYGSGVSIVTGAVWLVIATALILSRFIFVLGRKCVCLSRRGRV